MGSQDVAVITGAAMGIGREIALELSGPDTHIVVMDIADGSETADLIRDAGGDAEFREGDVTDPDSLERALDGLSIDILVNNAGYFGPLIDDRKRFDEISLDEWQKVLKINTTGVFLVSKHAVSRLEEGARIVNIGSGVVIRGTPGFMHYVASKAAVNGMTRAMANELAEHSVRVNAVMPGPVATETALEKMNDSERRMAPQQAIDRELTPSDVAGAVAFLCSPRSEMITGQVINVDGGATHY